MSQAPANPPPAKKAAGGRKLELPEELKVYKGVWVIVEQERGKVHTVSYELLGEARKLADKLGVEVGAVVLGAPGPFINEIRARPSPTAPTWSTPCSTPFWPNTAPSRIPR
jgi:electron transfer flavoprotein alpha subunit